MDQRDTYYGMKHILVIYPLALLVLIVFIFFTGAYAMAEAAVGEQLEPPPASSGPPEPESAAAVAGHEWYESAAIWVCPLH